MLEELKCVDLVPPFSIYLCDEYYLYFIQISLIFIKFVKENSKVKFYLKGKQEVASILLDHNAPIEAETRKGFTPLHLAAKYGDIGVARLLLARGAQPDAPGKSHITPLHMATYYGHPDIALLLLDKGICLSK